MDVLDEFGFDIFDELRHVQRICGAGKTAILPDQNAILVAKIVKIFAFIKTAAPDPDHIHVGLGATSDEMFQLGMG